ncbi:MAG: PIN domain-containing protein [Myxococcales bacterium]|nr:PIN domain-containing protein [Myxococcales bacterium]MCB9735439.1 PIN domain-containing protein [Deltaproteobacteria bacterium]
MADRTFIDTNVLVYADDASGRKGEQARTVLSATIRAGTAVISTQVLQEYYAVATRKRGVDLAFARTNVALYARLDVIGIDAAMVLAAIDLHGRHGLSIWDALIVRAAVVGGCRRLLSEDLNAGQVIEGVRVENPFA